MEGGARYHLAKRDYHGDKLKGLHVMRERPFRGWGVWHFPWAPGHTFMMMDGYGKGHISDTQNNLSNMFWIESNSRQNSNDCQYLT
jgi:hypothetical protein